VANAQIQCHDFAEYVAIIRYIIIAMGSYILHECFTPQCSNGFADVFCFNIQIFFCDGITNKPANAEELPTYFFRFLPQTEVKITELLTF
jgi:hypothetical protein